MSADTLYQQLRGHVAKLRLTAVADRLAPALLAQLPGCEHVSSRRQTPAADEEHPRGQASPGPALA
jgi:hypothetical protein